MWTELSRIDSSLQSTYDYFRSASEFDSLQYSQNCWTPWSVFRDGWKESDFVRNDSGHDDRQILETLLTQLQDDFRIPAMPSTPRTHRHHTCTTFECPWASIDRFFKGVLTEIRGLPQQNAAFFFPSPNTFNRTKSYQRIKAIARNDSEL